MVRIELKPKSFYLSVGLAGNVQAQLIRGFPAGLSNETMSYL
jgi:hypothetical protein